MEPAVAATTMQYGAATAGATGAGAAGAGAASTVHELTSSGVVLAPATAGPGGVLNSSDMAELRSCMAAAAAAAMRVSATAMPAAEAGAVQALRQLLRQKQACIPIVQPDFAAGMMQIDADAAAAATEAITTHQMPLSGIVSRTLGPNLLSGDTQA